MKFPNYFADAESDFQTADTILFGVPFGKTSSFRFGAEKGPQAIRQASWNFETYDIRKGTDLRTKAIHDYGDLDVTTASTQNMFEIVNKFATHVLNHKKFPVALGGEHSVTPPIIAAYPKDIGVIVLDAHLDFRENYENDTNNHACTIRRIADHITIENIAVVGLRSAEQEEFEDARQANLFHIDAFSILDDGIETAILRLSRHFQEKPLYLSIDIDVLDPAYAPGTSTPEPFGISPYDILKILDAFSSQLVGCDLVEVCPPYDKGETALVAAKLIRILLSTLEFKSHNK